MRVRALARSPETAGLPQQAEVVRGDLTLPETLNQCLDGIDTVFLVWTAAPARVASVQNGIFRGGAAQSVAALHAEIERLIETSGRQ